MTGDLEAANIAYRHPELYDQLHADPGHAKARIVEALIDAHGPAGARTLLDVGCGTGHDLEYLAKRFAVVGVDAQPRMVACARRVRPGLDLRVGDMRDLRLDRTFDTITCLGFTLAYLHTTPELRSAFATFAAHAHPGTLLVLQTPVAPVPPGPPRTARVEVAGRPARVTTSYTWDLRTQTTTLHRRWEFDDGETATDLIRRRVIFPRELELHLNLAGFELLDVFDDPADRSKVLTGPAAYTTARYLGS
ncbi:hypothetical protein TH66_11150 [Carbonactinospora thermoautotrophica]|uniref:Methyltransferase type 12 n=1 Tax=Carbonactinospora thermoautotrophica TaxID=1469144 RepID=A0A132N0F2_9ACTN|nr:class I SAM-dependent methyltransferase [Carbonactinospora thermoautotrophica]KWX01025.1 Methyltransferase type 12 [Carbonactinospora thermoautotrophica]KWX03456.1 hypothetical protein TH66_11150 [Carbonactinospora thermoautotrophica]KWX09069.1 hypothetical protein TR74_11845 [Carbonactinospora thermoautotrophica]